MKPKAKSNAPRFMLDMARVLSAWVSDYERDNLLYWDNAGYLLSTDETSRKLTDLFSIECKTVKDAATHNLFFGNAQGNTIRFWKQCKRDAESTHRNPLLALKQNRIGEVFITTHRVKRWLQWAAKASRMKKFDSLVDVNQPIRVSVFRMSDVLSIPFKNVLKAMDANEIIE